MNNNLFEYTDYPEDQMIHTQVCIIGTGCGGATLAKKLTDHGVDTVLLEQGGYYPAGKMDQNELNMGGKISAERNMATSESGISLLSGANVGGASVHYWADSYRTPNDKLEQWSEKYGVKGHGLKDLKPAFDEIEKNLHIHEAGDEFFNRINALLRIGAKNLNWHGHRVPQARQYCQKSGHCMQGCSYNAKQSQMVSHIPSALKNGARLYADVRAESLIMEGRRVKGVLARAIDRPSNRPSGVKLLVTAKHYVVAAGGFNSSFFLMKQGFHSHLPALGKHFSMNPSTMVTGLFDEPIIQWRNIPAAFGIDEFRQAKFDSHKNYVEGGYMLMPNQLHPAAMAAMLPGVGETHRHFMENYANLGGTACWIDDVETELGEIQLTNKGTRKVVYNYGKITQEVLRDSLKKQASLLFNIGAKQIAVGGYKGLILNSLTEIEKLNDQIIAPGALMLSAPHPGGGCRMGSDAKNSVVGSDHRLHGIDNLFVSDSSVFPTSSSVDPSLTIMAFSYIAASHILSAL